MKYKICNNGRAVLLNREIKMLDGDLKLNFDEGYNGYTAVIKIGENIFYRPIIEGTATLAKKHISAGPILISVIENDRAKEVWICDELYAVVKDDNVAVAGNMLEYDKLLAELRVEIDNIRNEMAVQEEELKTLRKHYEDIYAGYEAL